MVINRHKKTLPAGAGRVRSLRIRLADRLVDFIPPPSRDLQELVTVSFGREHEEAHAFRGVKQSVVALLDGGYDGVVEVFRRKFVDAFVVHWDTSWLRNARTTMMRASLSQVFSSRITASAISMKVANSSSLRLARWGRSWRAASSRLMRPIFHRWMISMVAFIRSVGARTPLLGPNPPGCWTEGGGRAMRDRVGTDRGDQQVAMWITTHAGVPGVHHAPYIREVTILHNAESFYAQAVKQKLMPDCRGGSMRSLREHEELMECDISFITATIPRPNVFTSVNVDNCGDNPCQDDPAGWWRIA